MIDELFKPAESIVPLTIWGAVGYGVLLLIALMILAAGTRVLGQGGGWAVLAGSAMAALGVHRFLRAVEPGDTWRITLVVVATVAAAMLLAWQARSDSTGVVAAGGAALGAGLLAVVTDVISEHLAAIPASWGLMLLVVVGLFAWSRSQ